MYDIKEVYIVLKGDEAYDDNFYHLMDVTETKLGSIEGAFLSKTDAEARAAELKADVVRRYSDMLETLDEEHFYTGHYLAQTDDERLALLKGEIVNEHICVIAIPINESRKS